MPDRVPITASQGVACRPAAAIILGSLLAAPAALADDAPNVLTDAFQLSLGSFIVSTDTEVRLDGDAGEGTNVRWEEEFGRGDVTRFRIDGQWRFADRHKARFLWFNSSRSDSTTLEEEIEWGGEIYPVDAKVRSQFDFDVYELAYEYAFLRRETYELSGTIGLHYTDLSLELAAKASTSNGTLTADIREKASVGAPLPVIGLRGVWNLPYNLWLDAFAQYFALSLDEYDGSLTDYKIMLTWQPKKWVGLGIGYNQFSVDVDVDKTDFRGSLDWSYKGPMIQYSVVF